MRASLALLAAAAAPSLAFWLGPRYRSVWLERTIVVDGKGEDWRSQEPEDAGPLDFAFANDDRDLYVLVAAHTKAARIQLSGRYGQDFILWLDPKAGRERKLKFTVAAPLGARERAVLLPEGVDASTAAAGGPSLVMGPMDERGVFEARIPLALLGPARPEQITVGIATTRTTRAPETPALWKRADTSTVNGSTVAARVPVFIQEDYLPLELAIRVFLARRRS